MFEVLFAYPKVWRATWPVRPQSIEIVISSIAPAGVLHARPCCAPPENCSSSPSGST